MRVDEIKVATEISSRVLETIPNYFAKHLVPEQYVSGDLEYLVYLMRGFALSYETVDLS
jgi:hypothetical protein